jgi:DNA-dependent RNA polymerase auxiliary subunit epsilon
MKIKVMTDKKIILNFVNRNYTVQLSDKFLIYDKIDHNMLSMESFYSQMVVILGDFGKGDNNAIEIVRKWVTEQKGFLVKDLHSFVKSVDLSKGFEYISEKMLKKYSDNFTYNKGFMLEYASEYYNERIILPKLKKHVEYLKNLDSNKLTYDKTISDFETQMKFEGFKQQEFVREYLLKWYKDTIIDEKIDDLLSQLIVTLGPRNWKVTWIGHGELNRPKIESIFGSQSPSIYEYIMDRYDLWYDRAVEKAVEKLVTSNYGGF